MTVVASSSSLNSNDGMFLRQRPQRGYSSKCKLGIAVILALSIQIYLTSSPEPIVTSRTDCALLFFGLPKHFTDIVLPSIRGNIVKYNPHCTIFAHSYNLHFTENARNQEPKSALHVEELHQLTPNVKLTPPFGNVTYFRQFYGHRTRSWAYPTSMDNMMQQWYSIEQVWRIMEDYATSENKQFARVGLFRSDTVYTTPISLLGDDAITPQFSMPANDRLFVGSYENAKIWATARFSSLSKALEDGKLQLGLNSEYYLSEVILPQLSQYPPTRLPWCSQRVRATGKIRRDDCWDNKVLYFLLHPWELSTFFDTIIAQSDVAWLFGKQPQQQLDDGRPDIAVDGVKPPNQVRP